MNFAEDRIIGRIVDDVESQGIGFCDPIVAIVLSEAFGVK